MFCCSLIFVFVPDSENIAFLKEQYWKYQSSNKKCAQALNSAKGGVSAYKQYASNTSHTTSSVTPIHTEPEVDLSELE